MTHTSEAPEAPEAPIDFSALMRENGDVVGLYWHIKSAIEFAEISIEKAAAVDWISTSAVSPHLEAAAQSLSVAISRLESASRRKFGEETWSRFIPSDTQTKEDPQ